MASKRCVLTCRRALSVVGGADENTFFEFAIAPNLLQPGNNVIAVEVHQFVPTSSDLSFDAELSVTQQSGIGIPINLPTAVKARTRSASGVWSAIEEADFLVNLVPASPSNLRITELHYNPATGSSSAEFIELRNVSQETIMLDGVRFSVGITYDFNAASKRWLAPGEVMVLAENSATFTAAYGPIAQHLGQYSGSLSNGGERLTLLAADGSTIQTFIYDDTGNGWHGTTDGGGPSLTVLRTNGNYDLATNYRPSFLAGGTPGVEENDAPIDIVLTGTTVQENLAGTTIGQLTANDPDDFETATFTLLATADSSLFSLVGNSLLLGPAALDFEASATRSVSIRVTDRNGLSFEKNVVISVVDVPELILAPVIADGSSQRSSVDKVTLTFDSSVVIAADAFSLIRRGTSGGTVATSFTQQTNALGQSEVTLSFSGSFTRPTGALADGYYQLTIDGTKITRGNVPLDIDQNGVVGDSLVIGDDEADGFFSLFGDNDGNGLLNLAEFGQFRGAFGKTPGQAGYNARFDFDGAGIGLADFAQFRGRFGKPKMPWQ
jgi:hypothetical protein